jgi:putative peptidoglycan lipid II flippase
MNLLRAASTISALTLVSRVTGLVRDILTAALFGASASMDAFNVAFRIPNLLRRLFAEGAFSQAFVPVLARTRAETGDETTRELIDAVATALFWALLLTSAVGIVAAPVVVWLMASGLVRFDAAVLMTRWMFPYIAFMSLVALSAGVLNTWKRFAVPAATPVLLNVAMIVAAAWLAPHFAGWGIDPIYAMPVGVMVGGALQLAIQVPALLKLGVMPRIALSPGRMRAAWRHPGVRRVLSQMAPALLSVSVAQFSLLINTQIASRVGVGAVSWLFYADRLMEFPTALLGVALGVVLMPQLAAAQGRKDAAGYSDLLDWGLRLVLLLTLPCAVALLVFPEPMVAVLFQRGAFGTHDVSQTVTALMGYGVGLLGLVAVKVLAPGYFARQDTRTPVKIAIAVLVVTQLLNLVFVPWLAHAGLALSIGCGALLNAAWLLLGLKRSGAYVPAPGWGGFALRVGGATLLLAAWLAWGARFVDWTGLVGATWTRIGWLALFLGGAALLYFLALVGMGIRLRHFVRRG